MDGKFIPCAKMFLLTLGRDPIEGLFFTKDLKIQFGPPADLAAAHKWWCLSDWHHSKFFSVAAHHMTKYNLPATLFTI